MWRQQFAASRRQFYCQRQSIQTDTYLRNGLRVRLRDVKVWQDCLCALLKELDCCIVGDDFALWKLPEIGQGQRSEGKLVFCLQMQHRTTRHHDFHMRTSSE